MAKTVPPKPQKTFIPQDELLKAKRAYDFGNPMGLFEAVAFCWSIDLSYPDWVRKGLYEVLMHYVDTFPKKKKSISTTKPSTDEKDFKCYRAILDARREGLKGQTALERAKNTLASTGINRTLETISDAFKKVQTALKTDEGRALYRQFMTPLSVAMHQFKVGVKESESCPLES